MLEAVTEGRSGAYSLAELVEAADGLARLVDTIRRGELTASPGTVPRLEGAIITLRSLAEGWPLSADNPDRGTDQAEHVHHMAAEPLTNAAGVPRGLTAAAVNTAGLAAVVADALAEAGRSLDDLSAAEAIEIADGLRAIVASLPALTTHDKRLATDLDAAAGIVEQRTGTG
jgi:hypothetical protein